MKTINKQVSIALFYSIISILLVAFAILCLAQGVMVQLAGESFFALVYYIIALLSLVTTYWIYVRARRVFEAIRLIM